MPIPLENHMWPLHTWGSTFSPRLLSCTSAISRRGYARSIALATSTRAESVTPSASALARVEALLDRAWLLKRPDTQLQHIRGTSIVNDGCGGSMGGALGLTSGPGFWVVRDDLLHPVAGGNKLRKLDALLPQLRDAGATDIVRPPFYVEFEGLLILAGLQECSFARYLPDQHVCMICGF